MLPEHILRSIPSSIRVIRKLTAETLNEELTTQQFRLMNLIHEGMGQTQMANTLQVSMAAVSKMVDHLAHKGLLKRIPGADRRCQGLILTAQGKKIHKRVISHIEKVLNTNLTKLTEDERSDLIKGLDVLDKLMGKINEK